MTPADAIRLIEVLIWPLVALVIVCVVSNYHLARLAITGRGMQQRTTSTERDRVVGMGNRG